MTDVVTIVRAALLRVGVIDSSGSVEAGIMEDAIASLNRMMRRWEADGIAVGWSDVGNPGDAFPAPPEVEQAVIDCLAVSIGGDYGHPADQLLLLQAKEGYNASLADAVKFSGDRIAYDDLPGANHDCAFFHG